MKIDVHLPASARDLRLDLFRGLANWAIFLDHIPNTALNCFRAGLCLKVVNVLNCNVFPKAPLGDFVK